MKLWLVGVLNGKPDYWEVIGIFGSEEKARAHCRTPKHFIGPLTLDLPFDEDDEAAEGEWPGALYPMAQEPPPS